MLIVDLVCNKFGLANKTEEFPVPQALKYWSNMAKWKWLMDTIDPIVEDLYIPFAAPSLAPVQLAVMEGDEEKLYTFPPEMRGQTVPIMAFGMC